MGRFTTPRRMGSTGWFMHAASRSAYNNRGSNSKSSLNEGAIYRRQRGRHYNPHEGIAVLFTVVGTPLLAVGALLTLGSVVMGSPIFFLFGPPTLAGIWGLIYLHTYRPAQRKGLSCK